MTRELQVVTISVTSLENSRSFYEDILGFEPDVYYEPTRWQSYPDNESFNRWLKDTIFALTYEPSSTDR